MVTSLLKKFFNPGQIEKPATGLPRIAPRVQLTPSHAIRFDLLDPIQIEDLPVRNLSASGVGFVRGSEEWPVAGNILSATVCFENRTIPLTLRIVHISPATVGCSFVTGSEDIAELVNRYFSLEIMAIRLVRVDPSYLKQPETGTAHWFRGQDNAELYFVESHGVIDHAVISFLGHVMEYAAGKGYTYGTVLEDSLGGRDHYQGSELIRRQDVIPQEIVRAALNFIENIPDLAPDLRKLIKRTLGQEEMK